MTVSVAGWVPAGLLCVLAVAAAACGGEAACVEVYRACAALYTPRFDEVFARTLVPKCGISGGACHGDLGRQRGLAFVTPDESYRLLLESRVVPGDPGCSLLVRRLESEATGFAMPPGARLSEPERCAIVRWIDLGAQR